MVARVEDVTISHIDGARDDVSNVARVTPRALKRVAAVGLDVGGQVTVTIYGSVDSFVSATGQTVDSIRAWSVPGHIHLLTLASWASASDDVVERRLAHELCHVGLWRRVGDDGARRLPRGLTEGICSVVADQGAERLGLSIVVEQSHAGRAVDFTDDSAFSYAVAHHVVAAAVDCLGWPGVWALVDDVAAGRATVADRLGTPVLAIVDGCPSGGVADPLR